jgi:hypothetical protein
MSSTARSNTCPTTATRFWLAAGHGHRAKAHRVAVAALLGLTSLAGAWASPAHVDQAVLLLRGGCGLENAKLDLSTGNDGRLHLQLSIGGTPRARTSLVHGDVERFTDLTLRLQGEQSLAMSACTGQAVNQIIGALLSLPPEVASLPLSPPPATAATGGGYVPPMLAPVAPAATPLSQVAVVVAVPAPAASRPLAPPSMGVIGELTVSIQGCNESSGQVFCEIKVHNRSPNDYKLIVQHEQSMLYDTKGGVYKADEIRMGNQGSLAYQGAARVKVIADTAPIIRLRFHHVPESVREVKRLEVTAGAETPDGTKMQKLTASNLPVQGR